VNVRPPFRLQLRKVFHRPRVVPEEIHPADAVILVDAEIHFADRIVDFDVVGESIRDVDVGIIVCGEPVPSQVPEDVHPEIFKLAGLTVDSSCLKIRDYVGDAVGTVARGKKQARAIGWHAHHRGTSYSPERVSHVVDLPFVSAKEKHSVF